MQVADLHVGLHDCLAPQLEDDSHGAVRRRVRRPHVQVHRLGGELELAIFEFGVQRFHRLSLLDVGRTRQTVRPNGMPSSTPNGASLLSGMPASSSVR